MLAFRPALVADVANGRGRGVTMTTSSGLRARRLFEGEGEGSGVNRRSAGGQELILALAGSSEGGGVNNEI